MDDMQEMLEHYRITRLISEYCHGCDRMDEVRMAAVYARDSWDDHGLNKMPGQDYSRQAMAHRATIDDSLSHHLGQSLVRIDGDRAGADTYFIATIRRVDDDGIERLHQLGGRYVDHLIREDGRWKIKKRITVRDWSISLPLTEDWIGQRNFVPGERSGADPSFEALGVTHSGIPATAAP